MKLADVRGHEGTKGILARALERDRVPPALLFAGPEGVGKKMLALALAQALLCERAPVAEACGSCRTCRRVSAGCDPAKLDELRQAADRHPDDDVWRNFRIHPDLVLAEGWWLTRTGRPRPEPEIRVDQVRDLIGEIAGAPFEARRRVFVIDDAHAMNEAAQNALLKSLEEPSPRSHVVLVTSVPLGLRQTILSRCQLLRFGPLSRTAVSLALRERDELGEEEARLRASVAGGSMRAALALEWDDYERTRETLLALLERLEAMDPLARMEAAEQLEQADGAAPLLPILRSLLRDVAALRAGAGQQALANGDVAERLSALARGRLGEQAVLLADRVAAARSTLRGFGNRLLTFEVLVDALAGD